MCLLALDYVKKIRVDKMSQLCLVSVIGIAAFRESMGHLINLILGSSLDFECCGK